MRNYEKDKAIGQILKDCKDFDNVPHLILALAASAVCVFPFLCYIIFLSETQLKNGIEEYLLGSRTLIYFNTVKLVKSNGETPYEQSKGYFDFYQGCIQALESLKTCYSDGYAHLRKTTREWVKDARSDFYFLSSVILTIFRRSGRREERRNANDGLALMIHGIDD
jgi:hypothetical protein